MSSNISNTKGSQLFRDEVFEARQAKWMGAVRLAQPLSYQLVGATSVALLILIISFLIFGEYTKKAFVAGVVTPTSGALRLSAPASGVVEALYVREGQSVAAGDVLFSVSTERISSEGNTHAAIAAQLTQRQTLLARDKAAANLRLSERVRSAQARLSAIGQEEAQLNSEQSLQKRRISIAEQALDRHNKLVQDGFISPAQAEQKRDELIALEASLETSKRNALSLNRERLNITAQLDEAKLSHQDELATTARNQALLIQETSENHARRLSQVRAPIAGTIAGLNTQGGQTISAGQLMATLLPKDAKLQANFFAPSRTIGFVEPGQTVRMRYSAYPYQKFGQYEGVITEVSLSPLALNELPTTVVSALASASVPTTNEQLYRIEVSLASEHISAYGKAIQIRAGMSVEGDVVQDTRRLHEWILEPLYAMKGRV